MATKAQQKAQRLIEKLKEDSDVMQRVMTWIVANQYHEKYQECTAELSDGCIGVGLKIDFHGKHCPECRLAYRRNLRAAKKAKSQKV